MASIMRWSEVAEPCLMSGIGNPSRMFSDSNNTVPPEEGSGIDTMS
jgi:hypothetical protein